jgi:hemolysin III
VRGQVIYHGERFNAWTHLIGAVLALTGAVWLQVLAAASGDAWKMVSVAVYGATLVLLYAISTTYHSVRGRLKRVFQKLDHLSIYLLIAGSYTPFCLISLRGPWGWTLFIVVWSLALLGMLQEIKPRSEARVLSLIIYALMGWIVLVAIEPLLDTLGLAGFLWLAAGGLFYTVGIVFFAFDERFRHWHGIWHLFVITGSLAHFIAILFYVL